MRVTWNGSTQHAETKIRRLEYMTECYEPILAKQVTHNQYILRFIIIKRHTITKGDVVGEYMGHATLMHDAAIDCQVSEGCYQTSLINTKPPTYTPDIMFMTQEWINTIHGVEAPTYWSILRQSWKINRHVETHTKQNLRDKSEDRPTNIKAIWFMIDSQEYRDSSSISDNNWLSKGLRVVVSPWGLSVLRIKHWNECCPVLYKPPIKQACENEYRGFFWQLYLQANR